IGAAWIDCPGPGAHRRLRKILRKSLPVTISVRADEGRIAGQRENTSTGPVRRPLGTFAPGSLSLAASADALSGPFAHEWVGAHQASSLFAHFTFIGHTFVHGD